MVSEVISEKSEKSEDEVENVLRVGGAKWKTQVTGLVFPHYEPWQEKDERNSNKGRRKFLIQLCWSNSFVIGPSWWTI